MLAVAVLCGPRRTAVTSHRRLSYQSRDWIHGVTIYSCYFPSVSEALASGNLDSLVDSPLFVYGTCVTLWETHVFATLTGHDLVLSGVLLLNCLDEVSGSSINSGWWG